MLGRYVADALTFSSRTAVMNYRKLLTTQDGLASQHMGGTKVWHLVCL